jgi:IQ calmodulin-binding motif
MDSLEDKLGKSSEIDLLFSGSLDTSTENSREEKKVATILGEAQEWGGRQQHVFQKERTTPSLKINLDAFDKTPGPRSSSLFDKLDQLEKRWTDQATSKKKLNVSLGDLYENLVVFDAKSPIRFAPSVDSISPITLFEPSPRLALSSPTDAGFDDTSLSTYGSLGDPRGVAPVNKQLFGPCSTGRQGENNKKQYSTSKKPHRKVSLLERLHPGHQRTSASRRLHSATSVRQPVFETPSRRPTALTRKHITTITQSKTTPGLRFVKRQPKVTPMPSPIPPSTSTSRIAVSHLPQVEARAADPPKSVYERLYRNERRSFNLWTDPGAKRRSNFRFIASDGASRTKLIVVTGNATAGIKRKLFLSRDTVLTDTGKSPSLIQNAWRCHQAQSHLLEQLVQHWSVSCYPGNCADQVPSKRILRLRFGVLARTTAMRKSHSADLGQSTTVRPQDVLLDTIQEVYFESWENDTVVHQRYSLHVRCEAKMIAVLKTWSLEKLAFMLYRLAVAQSYLKESDNLIYTSAAVIQAWCFSIAHRRRKRSIVERQLTTYESLSWFHDRLQREATAVVMSRFDSAATIVQKHYRRMLVKRYFEAIRRVYMLKLQFDSTNVTARVKKAALLLQSSWREARRRSREGAARCIQYHFLRFTAENRRRKDARGILLQTETRRRIQLKGARKLVGCATKIQAVYRGRSVRRRCCVEDPTANVARIIMAAWTVRFRGSPMEPMEKAICMVQSAVRMMLTRKRFRQQWRSVVVIQALHRCRHQRSAFQRSTAGIVRLQAMWRAYCVRGTATGVSLGILEPAWAKKGRLTTSAMKIQSFLRMHRSQKVLYLFLKGLTKLQAIARSWHVQHCSFDLVIAAGRLSGRSKFLRRLRSRNRYGRAAQIIEAFVLVVKSHERRHRLARLATAIQSVVRMHRARALSIEWRHERDKSALTLQSWLRMVKCHSSYYQIRVSIVIVQRQARRLQARLLMSKINEISTLRCRSRVMEAMSRHLRYQRAVLLIQRFWRGKSTKQMQAGIELEFMFWKTRAAVVIQAAYRTIHSLQAYKALRCAVLRLQSRGRGHIVRLKIEEMRQATVKLQSCWKRRLMKRAIDKYLRQAWTIAHNRRKAAIIVQSAYRAFQPHQCFIAMRQAVVNVQRIGRGFVSRKRINIVRTAATKVQKHWRGHGMRRALKQQHDAARTVQLFWLWRAPLRSKRAKAVLVVQSAYRAFHDYQAFIAMHQAMLKLQGFGRGYMVRVKIHRDTRAAIVLQRYWKRYLTKTHHAAARILQNVWCATRHKSKVKSALVVQSAYRAFHPFQAFFALHQAALKLQSFGRSYILRMKIQRDMRAAILLQRCWKRHRIKTRDTAARMLQNAWHANHQRYKVRAAVVVQSGYRRFHPNQAFISIRRAAVRLQSSGRGYMVRVKIEKLRRAFMLLQKIWKRWFQKAICSMIHIQRVARGSLLRQLLAMQQRASRRLQATYRGFRMIKSFRAFRASAVRSQRLRRTSVRRRWFVQRTMAASVLQAWFRWWVNHYTLIRSATCMIQRSYRMFSCRARFLLAYRAILVIQHFGKRVIRRNLVKRNAAKKIKARLRSSFQRGCFLKLKQGVIVLQSLTRFRRQQSRYCVARRSILHIQTAWRRFSCRAALQILLKAVTRLQREWRQSYLEHGHLREHMANRIIIRFKAWHARRVYLNTIASATTVQLLWRSKLHRKLFKRKLHAALILQRMARKHVVVRLGRWGDAATVIQHIYSKNKHNLPGFKERKSALIVQRHARAWICRRNLVTLRLCAMLLPPNTTNKFKTLLPGGRVWGARIRILLRDRSNMSVRIQTWWRLSSQRSRFLIQKKYTTLLQHWLRRFVIPMLRLKILAAGRMAVALIVQRRWRQCIHRAHFQSLKRCVTLLQSWWRNSLARRNATKMLLCGAYLSNSTLEVMSLRIQGSEWGARVRKQLRYRAESALVIQMQWKVYLCKARFTIQRKAAILVQSSFRSWTLHQEFVGLKLGVQQIQSAWRCYQEKVRFTKATKSIVAIQRVARKYSAKKQIHLLQQSIAQLELAQAKIRGWLTRERLKHQSRASSAVQTCWRGYRCKSSFTIQREGVILVQASFRCWRLCGQFKVCKLRAKQIQSAWRRHQEVQLVRSTKSIVAIQSVLRRYSAKKQYHLQNNFIGRVQFAQAVIRGWRIRQILMHQARASTIVQASWRSYHCKSLFAIQRQAVAVLQACFRGGTGHRQFMECKLGALQIQSTWRFHQRNVQSAKFRKSIVAVQRVMRRYWAMKQYHLLQNSIAQLKGVQAVVRGWLIKQKLKQQLRAATVVQTFWRGYLCKSLFVIQRGAVTVIQAYFRGWSWYQCFMGITAGMQQIQSVWRCHQARTQFANAKKSSVTIQGVVRRHLAMKQYHRLWHSIVSLKLAQAVVRGRLARLRLNYQSRMAAVVQACWRGHHCKSLFAIQRQAVVVMQASHRGWTLRKQFIGYQLRANEIQSAWRSHQRQVQYSRVIKSIVVIQSFVRMYTTREGYKILHQSIVHFKLAQAVVRGWLIRQRWKHLVCAAIGIQCRWRAFVTCRWFRQAQEASIILQCFAIQIMLRHQMQQQAARKLENAWRSHQGYAEFNKARKSIVSIQCVVRRHLAKTQYHVLQQFMVRLLLVHAVCRGWMARQRLKYQARMATAVQTRWRHRQCVSFFAMVRVSSILIQAAFRSWILHQRFMGWKLGAEQIQLAWRCHREQAQFVKAKKSILVIQSGMRLHLAQKQNKVLQQSIAALEIAQAAIRGWLARRRLMYQSRVAAVVQACWRGYYSRSTFATQRHAGVVMQAVFRSWTLHQRFIRRKLGAQHIQSAWRCHQEKVQFAKAKKSIVAIQSVVRRHSARKQYNILRQSIVQLELAQASIRGWMLRRSLMYQSRVATVVQACWRGYHFKSTMAKQRHAVVVVQAYFRGWSLRWQVLLFKLGALRIQSAWRRHQEEVQFVKSRKSIVAIQSALRRFAARKQYHLLQNSIAHLHFVQAVMRGSLIRHSLKHEALAAIAVQACWRGYDCRSSLAELRGTALCDESFCRKLSLHKQEGALRKHPESQNDREELYKVQHSLVVIQRSVRWYSTRTRSSLLRNHSIRTVRLLMAQASIRGWLARQRLKRRLCAATTIQTNWRAYGFNKRVAELMQSRFAVNILISLAVRQKRQNHAALRIQRWLIVWKMGSSFLVIQSSLILMKRSCNGQLPNSAAYFAIRQVNKELRSAVLSSRIHLFMKGGGGKAVATFEYYVSVVLQRAVKKLLVIQRAWKRWSSLPYRIRISPTAIMASGCHDELSLSWLLVFHVRQSLEDQMAAAAILQHWFRRWVPLKHISRRLHVVNGIVLFQSSLRRLWAVRNAKRLQFEKVRRAAVTIQCQARVWLARTAFRCMLGVLQRDRVTERCRRIREELEEFLLDRVFKSALGRAVSEVERLLSNDEENTQLSNAGVCLSRLAHRVILGRIKAAHDRGKNF